jgi:uncharacterized protein YggE
MSDARSRTQQLLFTLIALVAILGAYVVGSHHDSAAVAAAPPTDPGVEGYLATGTGEVRAVPDQLTFGLTVTQNAVDSVDALNRTGAHLRAVRRALVLAGVRGSDIATTSVDLEPTYRYTNDGQSILTGFTASEGLSVLVRSLPNAGKVLGSAATALGGSGTLGQVAMTIGDRTPLLARARAAAMTDSRAAAAAYAAASGGHVGKVLYVEEVAVPDQTPVDPTPSAMDSLAAGKAVTIEPGQQKVTVEVKVRWAID